MFLISTFIFTLYFIHLSRALSNLPRIASTVAQKTILRGGGFHEYCLIQRHSPNHCNYNVFHRAIVPEMAPLNSHSNEYNNYDTENEEEKEEFMYDNYDYKTAAQIRKAKQLLRDAKQKIEDRKRPLNTHQQEETDIGKSHSEGLLSLPFFAQWTSNNNNEKIKSKTPSGAIIANGDLMSRLSQSEQWELRSLSQLTFVPEPKPDYFHDSSKEESDPEAAATIRASRVAAATAVGESKRRAVVEKDLVWTVYSLRKMLHEDDFKRVFDPKNRFIGELD